MSLSHASPNFQQKFLPPRKIFFMCETITSDGRAKLLYPSDCTRQERQNWLLSQFFFYHSSSHPTSMQSKSLYISGQVCEIRLFFHKKCTHHQRFQTIFQNPYFELLLFAHSGLKQQTMSHWALKGNLNESFLKRNLNLDVFHY